MVFNKGNKKEISAIQDLIKAKIYVNPKRLEELSKLKDDIWSRKLDVVGEPCKLLCFNLSPDVEERLESLAIYRLQVERISEDPADASHKEGRKRFLNLFSAKRVKEHNVVAVVHELGAEGEDDQLTLLDRRVIALSLLNKLPVVVLTTRSPGTLPAASEATGNTWPVFFVPHPQENMRPVCEWLLDELPRVRALSATVEEELQERVAHLAKVNAPLHFLKRASVALVPFGVAAVNFLGILRLMASMLQCVGMRGDNSAGKALGLLGAQNAALVTAVDSLGDIYSFAVFSTVLADLQGLGLVEAAAALDVLDGLMLGSISVVTGAVSALGAYLSRPQMVRSAAEFLASLQIIHVLNPDMRRQTEFKKRGSKGAKKMKAGRPGRAAARVEAAAAALAAQPADADDDEPTEVNGTAGVVGGVRHGDGGASLASTSDEATTNEEISSGEEGEQTDSEVQEVGAVQTPEGERTLVAEQRRQAGGCVDAEQAGHPGTAEDEGLPTSYSGQANGGASQDESDSSAHGQKLSHAEKKRQALALKQAAREAKTARAAAKAAALTEKKATKLAERERKRQAKQKLREQKAAEKVAKKLAKAHGLGEGAMEGETTVDTAASESGSGMAKAPWWRRLKAARGAVEPSAGGEGATGALDGVGGLGRRQSSTSSGDASSEDKVDEADKVDEVEAAISREARLGLNENIRYALIDFLNLPDEEVYDQAAAAAQQSATERSGCV